MHALFKSGLAATVAGLLAVSASAQDPAYTPADAAMLEQCLAGAEPAGTRGADRTFTQCIGIVAEACQNESHENRSTFGMTGCALRETAWWDADLNRSYDGLEQALEPAVFAELRAAQRVWIDFRDADCGFQYTHWQEGTIRSIFASSCRLQRTAERALDLREYLGWTEM